jgi:class 3 adenylate cyclase
MPLELDELLENLHHRNQTKFAKRPTVVNKDDSFDVEKLPINAPEWHAIDDVVSVYFDLKSSTNLAKGRRPESTASIYDAGVGGVAKILREFDAQFVDIQGDGGFGLFWGTNRYQRAVTAGITVRTFSIDFTTQLETKWPEAPSTGFKVGIASGSLMAKRVGLPRHLDFQEPVWAGNPVNYAAKAAQQTTPDEMFVTGSVWDPIRDNDFLVFSCGCATPTALWNTVVLEKIPDDEQHGHALKSAWCSIHGEEYCEAVLSGKTRRDDITVSQREELNRSAEGTSETHNAVVGRAKERERVRTVFAELSGQRGLAEASAPARRC